MSDPVLITIIICLTAIFITAMIGIMFRWYCVLLVSSKAIRQDDEFLTIEEFQEYEHIISDALFGLKLWGSSHVRTPEYADSSYYAGLRFGRQYTGVTLAGTVKSTWVFDDTRGLSYIDFIPEAYFRFKYDWHGGIGFDFRKSTNPHLLDNQEWLNLKLLRQYGNTQYVGRFDYEFDSGEVQVGANVKILF